MVWYGGSLLVSLVATPWSATSIVSLPVCHSRTQWTRLNTHLGILPASSHPPPHPMLTDSLLLSFSLWGSCLLGHAHLCLQLEPHTLTFAGNFNCAHTCILNLVAFSPCHMRMYIYWIWE